MLDAQHGTILINLVLAWLAGSLIGLERTRHGRPAGFRTHALVCLASAMLMVVTVYQGKWMTNLPLEAITTDPTRMAQGIMTGIGFLGAGVIFKDGLTVRGLTTAASIWITSALGILYGIGFYFPALATTAAVLGTLALFRWVEQRLPSESYFHVTFAYSNGDAPDLESLRAMLAQYGFAISSVSYRLTQSGEQYEYRMVLVTERESDVARLADALRNRQEMVGFRIAPRGDSA